MYRFELTANRPLIESAFLHPINRPWLHDESPCDDWELPIRNGYLYVACYRHEVFVGIIALVGISDIFAIAHIAFLPDIHGHAASMGIIAKQWIWDNTSYTRLEAPIVRYNSLARRFITLLGFEHTATNESHWLEGGHFHPVDYFQACKLL